MVSKVSILFLHRNRLLIKILWRFVRISIFFHAYFYIFDKISIFRNAYFYIFGEISDFWLKEGAYFYNKAEDSIKNPRRVDAFAAR